MPVVRGAFAAALSAALAAGAVQGQSITGIERSRKPSPSELLAQLRGDGTVAADSLFAGATAIEETAETIISVLEQPLKVSGADHLARDQLVTLKLAMVRAEADVRHVVDAVESGKLRAAEGRARIVETLTVYSDVVRSFSSSADSAERR